MPDTHALKVSSKEAAARLKAGAATVLLAAFCPAAHAADDVQLLHLPVGGIQPQVVADASRIHVVYFKGQPAHGDLFYVFAPTEQPAAFSAPQRVNSVAGSACALGTIRGASIALGGDGRVLVAWNGSDRVSANGRAPMLFSRLKLEGGGFTAEQDLIKGTEIIDGGGAIAADRHGNVYVFWHAVSPGQSEAQGRVHMVKSGDDGATFARQRLVDETGVGTCGCCGMHAMVSDDGSIYVLYRAATGGNQRDTTLLMSSDKGASFNSTRMQRWQANVCPMTLFSICLAKQKVLGAWETAGRVYMGQLPRGSARLTAAPQGGSEKYPWLACGSDGRMLLTWIDGGTWGQGGALHWQMLDQSSKAVQDCKNVPATPPWSYSAAVALPGGRYAVVY